MLLNRQGPRLNMTNYSSRWCICCAVVRPGLCHPCRHPGVYAEIQENENHQDNKTIELSISDPRTDVMNTHRSIDHN